MLTEAAWATVCRGDKIKSPKTGKLYEVLATSAAGDGTYRLTVRLDSGPKKITRPTPAEPAATVERGPEGQAVQMFVEVFSS